MTAIKLIQPLQFLWQTQDPFLFCAFHNDKYPKGNGKLGPAESLAGRNIGQDFGGKDGWSMYHGQDVPGFPAHPHKGFETITIAETGLVDHSDSLGAAGRFGDGDVQWMTAGGGVQHSEMFPLLKDNEENPLLLFQVWLNLPAKSKNVPAHFAMLWSEDIPVYESNGAKVKIVSGKFGDKALKAPAPDSFAADEQNDVAVYMIELEEGASLELPTASAQANRSLYMYEGSSISVNEATLENMQVANLAPDKVTTLTNAVGKAMFLLLQGKPIGEPVAKYGPFVMNTQQEIQEAMMNYQRTQFGGWPWPSHSHTHSPEKGRFALHANGKEEVKE